jgi:23S rRNA pseudouridine955/2504/2580 synthase
MASLCRANSSDQGNAYIITVAEAGMKVLRFLERKLDLPRPVLFRLLRTGQIRVNRGRIKPGLILCAGDAVKMPWSLSAGALMMEQKQAQANMNMNMTSDVPQVLSLGQGLDIVHMDDFFLVLNKASGLPVQPGSKHTDSVSARLKNSFSGGMFTPAPAHRLDKQSSGLILAGRTHMAQRCLHSLFLEHKAEINRIYLVWVSGLWNLPEKTLFRDYLAQKRGTDGLERMYAERRDAAPGTSENALEALAEYVALKVLPELTISGKKGATLMAARLLTGRKHQIRVQCASRGHPVAGDVRYAGAPYPQMLLHACKITIPEVNIGVLVGKRQFESRPKWPEPFAITDEIWSMLDFKIGNSYT